MENLWGNWILFFNHIYAYHARSLNEIFDYEEREKWIHEDIIDADMLFERFNGRMHNSISRMSEIITEEIRYQIV